MSESEVLDPDAGAFDPDRPVPMHPLVYLVDGDDVTVGRHEIASYAVLPPDGAELVRKLADGATPREAAAWYEREYAEAVDIDDVLGGLAELGFLADDTTTAQAPAAPVRWQRLGRALFSPAAWLGYALLIGWAVLEMLRMPDLQPSFRNIFYIDYYALIQATVFVAALPLMLLHEAFHALAGRRLGLPSSLSVGRRLYFIVLETSMDGLVTVPRRQRYLPILAGMLADALVIAVLTLAADLTRAADGSLTLGGKFCLAVAFGTLLRIVWQFSFYLRTDLYALIVTVLGCVDLHGTVRQYLGNRWRRLRGRAARHDEARWHPVDRRVARWYAWLVALGYLVSISTFVLALAPIAITMFTGVFERFTGADSVTGLELLDSTAFVVFSTFPFLIYALLTLRDRRRRRAATRYRHVIA